MFLSLTNIRTNRYVNDVVGLNSYPSNGIDSMGCIWRRMKLSLTGARNGLKTTEKDENIYEEIDDEQNFVSNRYCDVKSSKKLHGKEAFVDFQLPKRGEEYDSEENFYHPMGGQTCTSSDLRKVGYGVKTNSCSSSSGFHIWNNGASSLTHFVFDGTFPVGNYKLTPSKVNMPGLRDTANNRKPLWCLCSCIDDAFLGNEDFPPSCFSSDICCSQFETTLVSDGTAGLGLRSPASVIRSPIRCTDDGEFLADSGYVDCSTWSGVKAKSLYGNSEACKHDYVHDYGDNSCSSNGYLCCRAGKQLFTFDVGILHLSSSCVTHDDRHLCSEFVTTDRPQEPSDSNCVKWALNRRSNQERSSYWASEVYANTQVIRASEYETQVPTILAIDRHQHREDSNDDGDFRQKPLLEVNRKQAINKVLVDLILYNNSQRL